LYVAREHLAPTGLFDSELVNFAEGRIQAALDNGILVKRPNKRGHFTWGPKNKLAVHVGSGIPVDLFATTEENWWVSLVIRTGSKETNLKLAMGAQERGRSLEAYGSGVRDLATGEVTPATSERQVFELCGVEYLEPEYR
jgi:DNA polymerase/3'-5' exonuclease PolX